MGDPGARRTSPRVVRHVILDRDGVLNREGPGGWVTHPDEWRWEDGARDGLAWLADQGVAVSIATNQSGIGRGVVAADRVDALHGWLRGELAALGLPDVHIATCPHAPADGCGCRKPAPGLVLEVVRARRIPVEETVLVGDDDRDLDAAEAAGVAAVLVRTGKGRATADRRTACEAYDDLPDALRAVVGVRA